MIVRTAFAIAAMVVGTASYAATETFDFTGNYTGTYSTSMSFTGDKGTEIDVSAIFGKRGKYYHSTVGQWTGGGLGACNNLGKYSCKEGHTVDGYKNRDDYLKFSLDHDVTISSITFSDYGNNSFEVYADGAFSSHEYDRDNWWSTHASWDGEIHSGSTFFIGAVERSSGFKVKSITVDYKLSEVPLPAAGFLLLGGLGGLAALKRRNKA